MHPEPGNEEAARAEAVMCQENEHVATPSTTQNLLRIF